MAIVAGVMLTVILLLLLLPMMIYLYRRHGWVFQVVVPSWIFIELHATPPHVGLLWLFSFPLRRKQRRPRTNSADLVSAQEALPVYEDQSPREDQLRSHSRVVGGGGIVRMGGSGIKDISEPYSPPDTEEVYLKPAPIPRSIDQPPLKSQPLLADVHRDPRFNTYQPEAPNKQNRGRSIPSRSEYKHIWERPLPVPGEAWFERGRYRSVLHSSYLCASCLIVAVVAMWCINVDGKLVCISNALHAPVGDSVRLLIVFPVRRIMYPEFSLSDISSQTLAHLLNNNGKMQQVYLLY